MLSESYQALQRLGLPHGLYVASPSEDYQYVWVRDCVYMALPYADKPGDAYEKTYRRLFGLFKEYEWKLDLLCRQKPVWEWEYLHARYSKDDVKEIHDQSWGHVQHDMVGAFLYGVGLGVANGKKVIPDKKSLELVQKLADYLHHVEYWRDADNGMWEEGRELHASSVGACLAGLQAVSSIIALPEGILEKGAQALLRLYPAESAEKPIDLAQLSLVYPYRIFTGVLGEIIVSQVEKSLLRERGVIRYEGDSYYSTLEERLGRGCSRNEYLGTEAEWTFGLPWLALCHLELGNFAKASEYVRRTEAIMPEPGVLPELYYAESAIPNRNTPLGWSCAMYILAKEAVMKQSRTVRTDSA